MIFLGLKGLGDFTILASFLNKSKEIHTVIIRKGLEELAIKILDKRHRLFILNTVKDIYPIYSLRRISYKDVLIILNGANEIRKLIKELKQQLVIDLRSLRNSIIYFGLNKKYLGNKTSIYNSYSAILDAENYAVSFVGNEKKILVFPTGSVPSKHINSDKIINLCNKNNINIENITIVVYKTHSNYVNNYKKFNFRIYDNIDELLQLIDQSDGIISVDTFQLHLAVQKEKPLIMAGNVNINFLPEYQLNSNTE